MHAVISADAECLAVDRDLAWHAFSSDGRRRVDSKCAEPAAGRLAERVNRTGTRTLVRIVAGAQRVDERADGLTRDRDLGSQGAG
jgi:hypothetical protein